MARAGIHLAIGFALVACGSQDSGVGSQSYVAAAPNGQTKQGTAQQADGGAVPQYVDAGASPANIPAPGSASSSGARVVVPISQTTLSDGTIRYSVPIRLGNSPPVQAFLDTGSTGLRILPDLISPTEYELTATPNVYSYASGVEIRGLVANATVSVGSGITATRIPVQIGQSIGCVASNPSCPAAQVAPQDFGLGGNGVPGQGFKAIIGVGLKAATEVINPLTRMGSGSWIVILPLPQQSAPGMLIINPSAADRARYHLFQLGAFAKGGWADGALPGCLANDTTARLVCGFTLLDTGHWPIEVHSSQVAQQRVWLQSSLVRLYFEDPQGRSTVGFQTGVQPGSRITEFPTSGAQTIVAGPIVFHGLGVLYDSQSGVIGFGARP